MTGDKPILRLVALVVLTVAAIIPSHAFKVYFDNSDTGWSAPKIHYWGGSSASTWSGQYMEEYTANPKLHDIWVYDVPSGTTGIIFNDGNNSQTDDIKGDQSKFENQVFVFVKKGTGDVSKTFTGYTIDNYVQPELPTYTIYFHNRNRWENVNVDIAGSGSYSVSKAMSSNLNSDIFELTFSAANKDLTCSFYYLSGSTKMSKTDAFKVIDRHIYTESGDKGERQSYQESKIPEKEVWFEPESPTQLDAITVYFNKAYKSGSALRNTGDIYFYTWLKTTDGTDKFGPAWSGLADKYKMKKRTDLDPEGNVYSISLEPSVEQWYGASAGDRFKQVGYILRDNKGNTKQHDKDQFIDLRLLPASSGALGAYLSHEISDGTLIVTCEQGKLYLTPESDQILKVFTLSTANADKKERPSISVVPRDHKDYALTRPKFDVTIDDEYLTLSVSGGVQAKLYRQSSLLTFLDANGEEYLSEYGGLINNPGSIAISFSESADEGIYGMGYNGQNANLKGRTMYMRNNQTGGWHSGTSAPHNICIPFFASTRGYGIYVDDHYRNAEFHFDASGTSYNSGSKNPVAYYFIAGGEIDRQGHASMDTVLQNYTRLTGLQDLPPFWALGYITSKYSFASRSEAEQTIANTKNINIPIDGIVFDIHWQGGAGMMGQLDWDYGKYNNPSEMIGNFRAGNVHSIAITEPFFSSSCQHYNTLKNQGLFSDNSVGDMGWVSGTTGLLDITNPKAVAWFKERYKERTADGIDSWWLDLGEPERHDSDSHYADGSSFDQIHNEYGNLWLALAHEAMEECQPDERHILMPRAGTSGMQRFNSFPWTGDILRSWGGLEAQVPALVNAAMSGVSYLGSDIGGFTAGGTDANLYLRWVQLGVFYPSMRTHSANCPEVWQNAYIGVRDDVRKAINLRYAYLPYTYTQSYRYTSFGSPIARPANFADADKSVLANEKTAYLWGPDIFVAPVLSYSNSRSITFPDGDWLDMTDWKTVYEGHSHTTYSAPQSVLPHFMRRGSFVTRYRQDTFTSTAETKHHAVTVDYFPSWDADTPDTSLWYDDDHISTRSLAEGRYLATTITGVASQADNKLNIRIFSKGNGWDEMYPAADGMRDILFRIHDFRINGNSIDTATDLGSAATEEDVLVYTIDRTDNLAEADDDVLAAPSRANSVAFVQLGSEEEVKNATDLSRNYYARVGNDFYLRMPAVNPQKYYRVEISNNINVSGLNTAVLGEGMSLTYADGLFTYQAPLSAGELSLDVYSTTGACVMHLDGLVADGYARQAQASLPQGVYIARLSGTAGNEVTVKIAVR